MNNLNKHERTNMKQRLTAFVSPNLVKRAKVRGALEGLTISEVVERALEVYAPVIEGDLDRHIHLKFSDTPETGNQEAAADSTIAKKIKHTKPLVVPR